MTEPDPTYTTDQDDDRLTAEILAIRQQAIGMAVTSERLLEALGRPVKSAIVTRRERRNSVRRERRKK